MLLLSGLILICSAVLIYTEPMEDWDHWYSEAQFELEQSLKLTANYNTAKNVIVFLGDGMGISTITAARIFKGQLMNKKGEEEKLSFEQFPHVALSKTYNTDRQVADSAGTATAFWCGYKANFGTLGVDVNVRRGDCRASLDTRFSRTCALEWAQQAGKRTGIVTNTRITHATPGALYSKSADRNWECDSKMSSENASQCLDIARQLVENSPGKLINVIFGGGREMFCANSSSTRLTQQQQTLGKCSREDDSDLMKQWLQDKISNNLQASLISTKYELDQLDVDQTEHVLGLFSDSHMQYDDEREESPEKQPSLAEMVKKAIGILNKGKRGFFLAVEGGRIDHAHHDTEAKRSLSETVAFEKAVTAALDMTSSRDTLIIVTADHSHTLTIQGYPARGSDIAGSPEKSDVDNKPYMTLAYSNGPNFDFTWNDTDVVRPSLAGVDTSRWSYRTPVGIPSMYETHGGEDVAIFASGPWSHLFHGVHEQNYIAHVMSFAARMGPQAANRARQDLSPPPSSSSHALASVFSVHCWIFASLYCMTSMV